MKILIVVLLLVSFAVYCFGDQLDIKPRYQDANPNDGYMDAGTRYNPYVIVDQYGNEVGSVEARYPEQDNKGTQYNPYEIDFDN